MMMVLMKNVKNVTVNVTLVMLKDVKSVLETESMLQNVDAQKVPINPESLNTVTNTVPIKSVLKMEPVQFVTINVKLVTTSKPVTLVLLMLGDCPHQTVHVKPDIGTKTKIQSVDYVTMNV
jgi:hypothetical protein